MQREALRHDVSWAVAAAIVEVFASCIREECQADAFAEVYERIKAGLEAFEIQMQRAHSPSNN